MRPIRSRKPTAPKPVTTPTSSARSESSISDIRRLPLDGAGSDAAGAVVATAAREGVVSFTWRSYPKLAEDQR